MKMTPIKKIILGIAAACIAISIITANNMASVMMLLASRNAEANINPEYVIVEKKVQVTRSSGGSSGSSSTGSSSTGSSSSSSGSSGSSSSSSSSSGSSGSSSSSSGSSSSGSSSSGGSGATTPGSKPESKAQIAELYNKALNNAKANAKNVVRVKDGATNYKGIAEAGGLSSATSSLMGAFMVGSREEIQAKNEAWALAESGIKSAECKEEGDYYILTITGNDEVNPKSGGPGVGSLCGVIQESTITGSISSVPGLELSNISIAYENVTTTAKIEKSTGNLVALTIDAPCILSLSAKLAVVSIDNAKVGIGVYTEYTMTY